MFFYTPNLNESERNKSLVYINSKNVQVYPCGRRSAQIIKKENGKEITTNIPFDPEARLNTEFNNRKRTSLNGFTDTFVKKWDSDNDELIIVIDGYDFTIKYINEYTDGVNSVNPEASDIEEFVTNFFSALGVASFETGTESYKEIYANILLEEVLLLSDSTNKLDYRTWILRNQTRSDDVDNTPKANLDLPMQVQDSVEYYFSGISFSVDPLVSISESEDNSNTESEDNIVKNGTTPCVLSKDINILDSEGIVQKRQKVISLRILEYMPDTRNYALDSKDSMPYRWQVTEDALLPVVKRGNMPEAVEVERLAVNKTIKAKNFYLELDGENRQVPTLAIIEKNNSNNPNDSYLPTFQLEFTFGNRLSFDNLAKRPSVGPLILGKGILGWNVLGDYYEANDLSDFLPSLQAPKVTLDSDKTNILKFSTSQTDFEKLVDHGFCLKTIKCYYIGNLTLPDSLLQSNSAEIFDALGDIFKKEKRVLYNYEKEDQSNFDSKNNYVKHLIKWSESLNHVGKYIISLEYSLATSIITKNENGSTIINSYTGEQNFILNQQVEVTEIVQQAALKFALTENKLKFVTNDNKEIEARECLIYYVGDLSFSAEQLKKLYPILDEIGKNFEENPPAGYTLKTNCTELTITDDLSKQGNYVIGLRWYNENESKYCVQYLFYPHNSEPEANSEPSLEE